MLFSETLPEPTPPRAALRAAIRAEKSELVRDLAELAADPNAPGSAAEAARAQVAKLCRRFAIYARR